MPIPNDMPAQGARCLSCGLYGTSTVALEPISALETGETTAGAWGPRAGWVCRG